MAYCSSCGNFMDPAAKFCSVCGAQAAAPAAPAEPVAPPVVEPVAPPVVEPVVEAPAAPTYYAPAEPARTIPVMPVISGKTKTFGFVGMGLGIGSLALAVLGIICVIAGMTIGSALGFGYSIGYGLFSWPCAILGMKFSNQSYEAGNTSNVCSIGRKMAIAGMIVSGVMMFLGFIDLVISM